MPFFFQYTSCFLIVVVYSGNFVFCDDFEIICDVIAQALVSNRFGTEYWQSAIYNDNLIRISREQRDCCYWESLVFVAGGGMPPFSNKTLRVPQVDFENSSESLTYSLEVLFGSSMRTVANAKRTLENLKESTWHVLPALVKKITDWNHAPDDFSLLNIDISNLRFFVGTVTFCVIWVQEN